MNTLTVERIKHSWANQSTYLRDSTGAVKAIIPNRLRQPRYGQKTIVVNCWTYNLDWSKVELVGRGKKQLKQKN